MAPKKIAALREWLRLSATLRARDPDRRGFKFKCYQGFVLAYGRSYESAPFDARERALVQQLLREHRAFCERGFRYKACFANSQELSAWDQTGQVVYVEGYVWAYGDRLHPVHHGWLTLHGKVLDVTVVPSAIAHPKKLPPEPLQVHGEFKGRVYFGVPFLRSHFRERSRLNLGHGSLLGEDRVGYPRLRYGGAGPVRRR